MDWRILNLHHSGSATSAFILQEFLLNMYSDSDSDITWVIREDCNFLDSIRALWKINSSLNIKCYSSVLSEILILQTAFQQCVWQKCVTKMCSKISTGWHLCPNDVYLSCVINKMARWRQHSQSYAECKYQTCVFHTKVKSHLCIFTINCFNIDFWLNICRHIS
jgi:hypothetical protein